VWIRTRRPNHSGEAAAKFIDADTRLSRKRLAPLSLDTTKRGKFPRLRFANVAARQKFEKDLPHLRREGTRRQPAVRKTQEVCKQ